MTMFNWWPLMWKKTHRKFLKDLLAPIECSTPTLTGWVNLALGSNPILDDMQAAQDCDAVMKAAKVRTVKGMQHLQGEQVSAYVATLKPNQFVLVENIHGKKKPRSGKRITSGSKKRRR